MTDDFDPYYYWLGIPPHERPLDHYLLLGVRRYEKDEVVIRAAADQRMTLLRTVQAGPRAPFSQQLLNEVAAAKVCLLNEATRTDYEARLAAAERHAAMRAGGVPIARAIPVSQPFHAQGPVAPPHAQGPVAPPLVQEFAEPETPEAESDDEVAETGSGYWLFLFGVVVFVATAVWCASYFLNTANEHRGNTLADAGPPTPPTAPTVVQKSDDDTSAPIVLQDGNGGIVFRASVAEIHGEHLAITTVDSAQVTTGWTSTDDWLSWDFKVFTPPKQGVFRLLITYSAESDAEDSTFQVAIETAERVCSIRPTEPGQYRTDEYKIAVRSSGKHTLTIKPVKQTGRELMVLKEIELVPLGHKAESETDSE